MIGKVRKAIFKYGMLNKGDRVVVAVSGGPDSVSLLKVLDILSPEYDLTLIAAHLNHGIRGNDSDDEEQFVNLLCKDMCIPFESKKIDILSMKKQTGKSVEEIGREERYRFFQEVAIKHRATRIAVGHHFHDQVETVLINLIRGSGLEGLKGMLPVRNSVFIRPLLGIKKFEILKFLEERGISYKIDKSNYEKTYLRNRIRKELITILKEENPNIEQTLFNMASIISLEDDFMNKLTDDIISNFDSGKEEDEFIIRIHNFKNYHEAIQNRIIKKILKKFVDSEKSFGHTHIKSVIDLINSKKSEGHLNLPSGVNILKKENDLYIYRKTDIKYNVNDASSNKDADFCYHVHIPGKLAIPQINKEVIFELIDLNGYCVDLKSQRNTVAFIDYDKVIKPLMIRTSRPGDRIQPLGMTGSKKVKSCFIDDKIKYNVRKQIPLLIDKVSVIWIMGVRLSDRVKITRETTVALKVEIV